MSQNHPEAQTIPAMKVWKLGDNHLHLLPKICSNNEYFAQLKKDGYWYQFEKTSNFSYLFSRNISVKTGELTEKSENVPHIVDALKILPANTILVGEVYFPNKTSRHVTSVMGCLPQEAIKRQGQDNLIHFYIHDILSFDGINLINEGALRRYLILRAIFNKFNLNQYDFIELAELHTENLQEFINEAFAAGEEGVILKKKDSPYAPGLRPAWSTIKIKKIDYADVICMGFCDPTMNYTGKELQNWVYWINPQTNEFYPTGSYYAEYLAEDTRDFYAPVTKPFYFGWKNSIRIGAYDDQEQIIEIGTISSGLTDELRQDFAENPSHYLGKVVSVQCMELNKSDKTIRHGFFKGFREDKPAKDCTLQNIF